MVYVQLAVVIAIISLTSLGMTSESPLSAALSQQQLVISDGLDAADSRHRSLASTVTSCYSDSSRSGSVVHFVVLDAGSTGTRAVAHRFQRNYSSPLGLDHLGFAKRKRWPGLAAYRHFPAKCRSQLESLLADVASAVPQQSRSSTCLLFRATAGFRLIDARSRYLLAREIRGVLQRSEFATLPLESVRMLDGSEEAKYTWLSVNYLLGNFRTTSTDKKRWITKPVIEMGGGSLQVAYESQAGDQALMLQPPYASSALIDAAQTIRLRAHSYLGLGIRESVLRFVGHDSGLTSPPHPDNDQTGSSSSNSGSPAVTYTTTCLADNLTLDFTFGLANVKLVGAAPRDPSRPECLTRASRLIASLGVRAEPELNQPQSHPVFGISGIYHLLEFMHHSGRWNVTLTRNLCPGRDRCKAYTSRVGDLAEAASAVCGDVPADGQFKPFYCINLAVTAALLAQQLGGGMGLRPETRLVALGGQDSLGWSLGLSLDYLTSAMAANSGQLAVSDAVGKHAVLMLTAGFVLFHLAVSNF